MFNEEGDRLLKRGIVDNREFLCLSEFITFLKEPIIQVMSATGLF